MRALLILAPALLLAGCGGGEKSKEQGTQISINGGENGNSFSADMGKDGKVSIDAPGFKYERRPVPRSSSTPAISTSTAYRCRRARRSPT